MEVRSIWRMPLHRATPVMPNHTNQARIHVGKPYPELSNDVVTSSVHCAIWILEALGGDFTPSLVKSLAHSWSLLRFAYALPCFYTLAFRNVWLYLGRRGATSFFRVSFSRNWCTEQNHAIYPPVWLPLGTSSPLSHAILQTLRCEWIRNMKKQRATFLRQETGWYAYRRLEAVLCIDLIHQHCSGSASALAKAGPWFPHPHYDTSPNRTRRFRRFGFVSNLLAPQDAATWEAVKAKGLAENFSFQGNHLI